MYKCILVVDTCSLKYEKYYLDIHYKSFDLILMLAPPRSTTSTRPPLSFKPVVKPVVVKPAATFPPGALVPGQRPDLALNSAQFAAARAARASGTAQGMSGRQLEVYVAQAAMNAK